LKRKKQEQNKSKISGEKKRKKVERKGMGERGERSWIREKRGTGRRIR